MIGSLGEVRKLKRDLRTRRDKWVQETSYKMVSSDDSHYIGEEVYAEGGYYKGSSPWGSVPGDLVWATVSTGKWVDVPATVVRKDARNKLKRIYLSSRFYTVRYAAGRALGKMFLGWKLNRWASALEREYRNITENAVYGYVADRVSDIIDDAHELSNLIRGDGYKCKRLEKFFDRVVADSQTGHIADTANKEAVDFNWRSIQKNMGEYRQYCNGFYGVRRRKHGKNGD